jgi:hypothetical protein
MMPMIVIKRRWWQFAHLMMSEEVSHIGVDDSIYTK